MARLDLLGETDTAELVHFELQSTNDPNMPLRMAEYALAIYKQFRRFAWQFVLYVGEPKLRMSPKLLGPNVLFRYELVDIREIDSDEFLCSSHISSNILAILGRVKNLQQTALEVLAHRKVTARRKGDCYATVSDTLRIKESGRLRTERGPANACSN